MIVYTVTETTPAIRITGEAVAGTMHTGLTDPFGSSLKYLHLSVTERGNLRCLCRQVVHFMASTGEEAAT
jgi:hypothetical protein